jgi:uncharacterized DUF497 family protein
MSLHNKGMAITFDPAKRTITLKERGIDFATDAAKVFAARPQPLPATRSVTARNGKSPSGGSTVAW